MFRKTLGALLLAAATSMASAQDVDESRPDAQRRTSFALLGGAGFAGRDRTTVEPPIGPTLRTDVDPDLSPLFTLRGDEALHPNVSLGATFGFERALAKEQEQKTNLVDFDLALRLHSSAGRVHDTTVQPYVLVPGGMTLEVLPDSPVYGGDRRRIGWNAGALLGLSVVGSSGAGIVVEGGYVWRKTYDEGTASTRATHERSNALVRAGFVFAF